MNYIGHLAFGIHAYQHLKDYIDDKDVFLTGCVAPDIAIPNDVLKSIGHYRNLSTTLYSSPDIKKFTMRYSKRITEDFIIGYFCHLYADMVFASVYLPKIAKPLDINYNFSNTKDAKYVKILKSNTIIPVAAFLSDIGIYDDYTKTNKALAIKFNISENIKYSTKDPRMLEIDPNKLCLIKDEVNKYLGQYAKQPIIKGDTLAIDIKDYAEFIEKYSNEFCLTYVRYLHELNNKKFKH